METKYFIDENGLLGCTDNLEEGSYFITNKLSHISLEILGGNPDDEEREIVEEYQLHTAESLLLAIYAGNRRQ